MLIFKDIQKQLFVDYNDLHITNLPHNEEINLVVYKDNLTCDFNIKLKNSKELLIFTENIALSDSELNKLYLRNENSIIIINNISSNSDEEIIYGNYFGTENQWYLEIISEVIKSIADNLFSYTNYNKYGNLIIIGTSKNSYSSLMLSCLIKNSSSICFNTPLELFEKYELSKNKKNILKNNLKYDNITEICSKNTYRLDIENLIEKEKYIPNSYLYINHILINSNEKYIEFIDNINYQLKDNEFSNRISLRFIDLEYDLISLVENTINNLNNINDLENSIGNNYKIYYKIVENTVKENDIIRFYGFEDNDTNELQICCGNKIIPFTSLNNNFSKRIGQYYDLPASILGEGIHDICLKFHGIYSKISKLFIKKEYNIMNYNIWSGGDYKKSTTGFVSGPGQNIEISNEWSVNGNKSFKMTLIGDQYTWTDLHIYNLNYGDHIEATATIKADCEIAIFFVFTEMNNHQTFSVAAPTNTPENIKHIHMKTDIGPNLKDVSLRFWIKGAIGSSIFVDNINIISKKKNIAIYGSCCTKDPFTSLFNEDYKKDYVAKINDQRHSLISTMQEKENVDNSLLNITPEYGGSQFITKCLIEDFNRNFIFQIIENEIDYLVMDVFFEVDKGILYYNNGKIMTNAKGFEDTEYYNMIDNIKILTPVDNFEEYFNIWTEYCNLFFDFLDSYCPNIKIVLSEIRLKDIVLRENGTYYIEKRFTDNASIYNPILIKLENYIKENFNISVVSFDDNTLCIENHVWGKHFVHYSDEYYSNFLKKFKNIVEMDDLRQKLIK